MGWFGRRKAEAQETRAANEAAQRHLGEFVRTRRGVEAWIEQPTSFNPPSILLVAADGETTRRGLSSAQEGYGFARKHNIPCYDAGVVPYPQRMRDYGAKKKRLG
ncbi:hypothetical protein [Tessaracoccus caeni]|uniref:hypothetical protein n=1 Tax=Tessaracoccus caeni TaxID=3031239 RepID=UPI0023DB0B8D|nr:hypothetical protein [Tessaracoccus caeni]MDF1486869.1 hypothetical protein [Tessaracoccus caeni]